ncbi:tetraacyldisaccharide 4'-kinase [Thioalkalivibrio sp. HK1]|uniref:tetraacyldisaccharide 4'-kinase n=1 Tax=Thioalkalivibrio sp. HK1 TaxID=1469245 RepID=UPI0009DE62BF|nr:tetraacyldisaccharide 4'-kinase [Thioalkalivibrio sp. HK1]
MGEERFSQVGIPPTFWNFWYASPWHPLGILLAPLGWLWAGIASVRGAIMRIKRSRSKRFDCPVVVVGNIAVGGSGKTPLVIALVESLGRHGLRVGIVCRGYGGRARHWPQAVDPKSDPFMVGDEAVLMARRAEVPVFAGPDRVAAIEALCASHACDVVLSDDGLQHPGLMGDVEIAVVDGVRGHGNGRCLPAGPLREPPRRLARVDFVVINRETKRNPGSASDIEPEESLALRISSGPGVFDMQLVASRARRVDGAGPARPLSAFVADSEARPVHAICAIGHPERFFRSLERQGLSIRRHLFADHHPFRSADISLADDAPVLMTEKDAIKCVDFADARHWYVPVDAKLPKAFEEALVDSLERLGSFEEPSKMLDGQDRRQDPGSPKADGDIPEEPLRAE